MENGTTEGHHCEPEESVVGVCFVDEQEEVLEEDNREITQMQLQGLVAELHEGLQSALVEVAQLHQVDQGLEERMRKQQGDMEDRIMGLRNSLNTFQEDLIGALSQIRELSRQQRDTHKYLDTVQSESTREVRSVPHSSRRSSKADLVVTPGLTSSLGGVTSSLGGVTSSPGSNTSTRTSSSEQDFGTNPAGRPSNGPKSWRERERKGSRDDTEALRDGPDNAAARQTAALELLESERVYVSYLSQLLKANITFNGTEGHKQDKRPFPSSLRFLIQQHLELLHTLQERVLRSQWQGIMGDVFMRLTSKESDFLDLYVSYLKELPECVSVVSMLECDMVPDDSRPSLHTLMLQPVLRIPEYLLLLQGMLRITDADHPDYFLLLVCIQQFRAFICQYSQLLQHNQEVLHLHRKELKRTTMKQLLKAVECGIQSNKMSTSYPSSTAILEHASQVKRSKQRLLEQIQSRRYQDWNPDQNGDHPNPKQNHHRYDNADRPSQLLFYTSDAPEPRNLHPKPTGLHSIPEGAHRGGGGGGGGGEAQDYREKGSLAGHQRLLCSASAPGSALADALGHFLLPVESSEDFLLPGDSSFETAQGEGEEPPLFDHCSSSASSSNSSIDIAFVRCPPTATSSSSNHGRSDRHGFSPSGGVGSQGSGYSKLASRGCMSPDQAVILRHHHLQHRPLQASQRKSKSLNGLQLESTVVGGEEGEQQPHLVRSGLVLGSHAKLERQGSKGCPTSTSRGQGRLRGGETDGQATAKDELYSEQGKDSGNQPWGEESAWRGGADECSRTPFSERSRKQDKGGFRNSFKKLFKKKSSGEGKERTIEKTSSEIQNNNYISESGKTRAARIDIDRGTAV